MSTLQGAKSGGSGPPRLHRAGSVTATPTEHIYMQQGGRKSIFTAGRPPWYDASGEVSEPFVIGICGGSASGKTTVAEAIIEELGVRWVVLMSLDSFYKALGPDQKEQARQNNYNFDHPDAFDFELCAETLRKLKQGKNVEIPVYDFSTHSRLDKKQTMYGANVIIFEGIMAFHTAEMRDLMDMKIFVDTDSDIRLARRSVKRDISERGRDINGVIQQYNRFVKPAFDEYIYPTLKYADVVVPRGADNLAALNLIVRHVQRKLKERGFNFREMLMQQPHDQRMPSTLNVLPHTKQIRGLHTIIRNRECPRDELIFYSNRLMRIAIEYVLSLMPYVPRSVVTPRNVPYHGLSMDARTCGVSIIRAGVTMEGALRAVVKDIALGKILIQTDDTTGNPALHFYSLPSNVKDYHVILMDATIATGAAGIMAIRVLLDHDVKEENIVFLSIVAAPAGIHSVAYAFPKVKIVTTAVDDDLNDHFHIVPGIGNFGDRYFGTE
eukprot:comp21974_c0_seq1/m.31742 comp21974_c0_seq1/g.31742  ORF comp21974_c0_seq1/g.31742 comp21974_c0_seq1/m.31742 type:complete len:495 (-) comp21974_c0_seq1:783-2267(-)